MKKIHLILLAYILCASKAEACSCAESTLLEHLERADYVFISKIVSKEYESNWFSADRTMYKHKVLKTLKGELSEFTYSFVLEPRTSCDYEPEMDVERVVIISGEPPFRLAGCLYGGDRVEFERRYPNWLQSLNKAQKEDADNKSSAS